ncbi:guanine nucleotide exchange protein smcr8a-like [Oscarella lobularis]|uniref:guanine nucleotide exchange protein smcr8a-like n=1 Tax=Oscarella lobularis TaxID=121494 RepID=UPI0033133D05
MAAVVARLFRQSPEQRLFEPLENDFVLVAEFSEQEGPKPLKTIPEDGGSGFDKNMFSVRIMAVDYQAQSKGEAFRFAIDTQVVQTEEDDHIQAHAYVHHFTLYDIHARGYVRPFCMTYVTGDHSKIMLNFDEMTKQFQRVSESFRFSNMRIFHRDLLSHRTRLRKTGESLIAKLRNISALQKKSKEEEKENDDIDGGVSSKSSWDDGFSYRRSELSEAKMALEQNEYSIKEVETILQYVGSQLEKETVRKTLRDLDDKSRATESNAADQDADVAASCSPPKGAFTQARRFEKPLRTLGELCEYGEADGLRQLEYIYKHFSRTTATLLIEKQDVQMMAPHNAFLTIGRSLVLNFKPREGLCSMCYAARNADRPVYHLKKDLGASTHSLDSFVSCSDDGFSLDADYLRSDSPWSVYLDAKENVANEHEDAEQPSDTSSEEIEWKEPKSDFDFQRENGGGSSESTVEEYDDDKTTLMAAEKTDGETVEPLMGLSPGVGMGRRSLPFHCYADHVESKLDKKPGSGILHFRSRCAFAVHLFAALLSGRTVVIIGSSEENVRKVILMLWLFVPGHSSRQQVIAWQTTQLSLIDLTRVKLVGISKKCSNPVPKSIRPYVTLYDCDREMLVTPPYKGHFVDSIVNRNKQWKSEAAYVAHIHSVFLEMAQKTYLFYHAFILNPSPGISKAPSSAAHQARERPSQMTPESFLSKLNVTDDDQRIIKHFANTVSLQQLGDVSDRAPTVHLDHRKCRSFDNGKQQGRWNR